MENFFQLSIAFGAFLKNLHLLESLEKCREKKT